MTDTNLAKIRLVAYTAVAGMLGLLVVLGYVTQDQSDMILAAVSAVLNAVTAILLAVAVRNITPDSWSRIRVLLYLAFSAVLAVFGVYGFVNAEAIATWLSAVDAVLNVVGIILLGWMMSRCSRSSTLMLSDRLWDFSTLSRSRSDLFDHAITHPASSSASSSQPGCGRRPDGRACACSCLTAFPHSVQPVRPRTWAWPRCRPWSGSR